LEAGGPKEAYKGRRRGAVYFFEKNRVFSYIKKLLYRLHEVDQESGRTGDMWREDGRWERKRRGGAAIWGPLRFREKVALSSDMQAYVKKSVVV
jgi:hypothetical protein